MSNVEVEGKVAGEKKEENDNQEVNPKVEQVQEERIQVSLKREQCTWSTNKPQQRVHHSYSHVFSRWDVMSRLV